MTSLVSLQPQTGAWLPRLERWQQVLSIPEDDPALAGIRFRPTAMRAAFRREVGLSIDEWLALCWHISIRYAQLAQVDRTTFLRTPTQLVSERFRAPLDPRFERALRSRGVTTLAKLGAAVLKENPHYAGIGTLLTSESLAARNAPFLDVGNDTVVPLGLHAIVERAVTLPRLVIAPSIKGVTGREVNNTIGKGFEAYVRDIALGARGRHQVLSGQEIDAIVPAADSRCDVLIVHQHSCLLVEAGLQTLTTKIPLGDVKEIRKKCESYHDKADQADATRKHLAVLASRHHLLAPTQVMTLVVTDVPVPLTAMLFEELQRQRPDRNPLFLVSIDEFERLIAAGEVFSIPDVVADWQAAGRRVPMLVHLSELQRIAPVPGTGPRVDPRVWIDWLGGDLAA
jgi:hypothetical protein